jgi:hypothetical protein
MLSNNPSQLAMREPRRRWNFGEVGIHICNPFHPRAESAVDCANPAHLHPVLFRGLAWPTTNDASKPYSMPVASKVRPRAGFHEWTCFSSNV